MMQRTAMIHEKKSTGMVVVVVDETSGGPLEKCWKSSSSTYDFSWNRLFLPKLFTVLVSALLGLSIVEKDGSLLSASLFCSFFSWCSLTADATGNMGHSVSGCGDSGCEIIPTTTRLQAFVVAFPIMPSASIHRSRDNDLQRRHRREQQRAVQRGEPSLSSRFTFLQALGASSDRPNQEDDSSISGEQQQQKGQQPPQQHSQSSSSSSTNKNRSTSSGSSNKQVPSSSRLEGNQRMPTEAEIQIMDEMIDKLLIAKPYELPNVVRRAFRVISSPRFFVRIAERTDQLVTNQEKEPYQILASNLVNTIEAIISTTKDQLDERAKEVQLVIQAAAEPNTGEFLVPLSMDRIQSMRTVLEQLDESSLNDEGFLSTIDSWMNKSQQDGMNLMILVLQKALQNYAAIQIIRAKKRYQQQQKQQPESIMTTMSTTTSLADEWFHQLLQTDSDEWDVILQQQIKQQQQSVLDNVATTPTTMNTLLATVQDCIQSIVLARPDEGSMAQRVQLEYLLELIKRIELMQQQQGKGDIAAK